MFSLDGFSVQNVHKIEFNPFITDNGIYEWETNAQVLEVEKFDFETPTKGDEEGKSRAELYDKPAINSNEVFDCAAEIPILLLNGNKRTFIRRSIGRLNDFDWDQYHKVWEIKVKSMFGFNMSLADVLAGVSQMKPANAPLRYRPVASLIQGGQYLKIETNTFATASNQQQTNWQLM